MDILKIIRRFPILFLIGLVAIALQFLGIYHFSLKNYLKEVNKYDTGLSQIAFVFNNQLNRVFNLAEMEAEGVLITLPDSTFFEIVCTYDSFSGLQKTQLNSLSGSVIVNQIDLNSIYTDGYFPFQNTPKTYLAKNYTSPTTHKKAHLLLNISELNRFLQPYCIVSNPKSLSIQIKEKEVILCKTGIPDSTTFKWEKIFNNEQSHQTIQLFSPVNENIQMAAEYKKPTFFTYPALFLLLSFGISILMFFWFVNQYQKVFQTSITELNLVVNAISNKEFETRAREDYKGELGLLAHAINNMSNQLNEIYRDLEIRVIRRTSEISMRNAELRKSQRESLKQNHEIKSAYDALKESREKYEQLILNLDEEYIFYSQSINGELLFVSPSVKKILGYEINEFRKLYSSLHTDNPVNTIARELSGKSRTGILQSKYLLELYDFRHKPILLEISEVPVFNEEGKLVSVEGLAHDITERQQNEELIKIQEEKYRMLFTHASDFIILYEIDLEKGIVGKILEANNYALQKLNYSMEELRQKSPTDLQATDLWLDDTSDTSDTSDNDSYLTQGGKFERIWENQIGELLDVEISSHNFFIRDKQVAIAIARDITDRKKSEEEIRFINEELYNQKENLEALVDNLTQAQEQLVQSEKMAALGQLISGIAHEINTPLGAIKASIGNLSDSLDLAMNELPAVFEMDWQKNLKLFNLLFEMARKRGPELSSREKRAIKKEIIATLQSAEILEYDLIADMLIFLDIFVTSDELVGELKQPGAIDIVRTTRNFISLMKNTQTINLAVEKATKVVFALKKYAHRDSGGEKIITDIIDNIETVLTLYNSQLKQGVEVERNFEPLPPIVCYPDEISQVWTNLVQNAIQAMKQNGTLKISAKMDNNVAIISFKDNGPGIEPDIINKIFEPFFTTKKQGEGTGLGLDIVKKIIEKHEGDISVISKMGEGAEFIIKLPQS